MNSGYQTYKNINIDTASQGKLILIAYDVAIKHCKMAVEAFGDRARIEERTKHLFKAQDAITELMSSLRLDVGEIARNLYRLYDYMLRTLVQANIKNSNEKILEVQGYLESLRSAWVDALDTVKRERGPGSAEPAMQQGFTISG